MFLFLWLRGIEIAGATVGVAFLDRMCVYDQSVGFTQVGGINEPF